MQKSDGNAYMYLWLWSEITMFVTPPFIGALRYAILQLYSILTKVSFIVYRMKIGDNIT